MYGLVDGPVLFQLAFLHFLHFDLNFYQSHHDDNFLMWYNMNSKALIMIVIIHVDDLLVMAAPSDISKARVAIERRFGKMKHNTLPLTWCGIVHERLAPGHYWCHQLPYLSKLKSVTT